MRLAVIADIHGNLAALEAVLDDIERQGADEIVIAGDVVNGSPDSLECWKLVRSLGSPMVRGNHERYLFDLETDRALPEWHTERYGPVQWTHRRFDPRELEAMGDLPLCLRLPQVPDLLIVHATARADREAVHCDTTDDELDAMFANTTERLVVRGHNHVRAVRRWRDRTVATTGSVGLPLDGSTSAKYLLVERCAEKWRLDHREVPYDLGSAVRRFTETGYLNEAGPMANLLLHELITARLQLMPFLRDYERWSESGRLPLTEAVHLFLEDRGLFGQQPCGVVSPETDCTQRA
jgi:predicted phosphodiesterase